MTEPLSAPHDVTFSYRRSVGGATQRFLAGLARKELWGARFPDGRVAVPPVDHDPQTGARADALVRVGEHGVVRSWSWMQTRRAEHPLDRPFAFAFIQLDGADTALLHVVDVDNEGEMVTGMRVHADWRRERVGSIRDIRAFVAAPPGRSDVATDEPHTVEVLSAMHLAYTYAPGRVLSGFLRALGQGRILGGRCPTCSSVYVPPRVRCPACGSGPMAPVDLADRGTIVSYTVVHVPFHGMTVDLPFAWAWIRLDGADVPFAHLLGETSLDAVRVGQRVEAVWAADEDLGPTWESIKHFRPLES